MRLTRLSLGVLTLLLLIAVPVSAAPALQKGNQSSYNLSISISFPQSCEQILSSTLSVGIACPMVAIMPPNFNINGTLGWTVTDLNTTTANLNVTRDLTMSNGQTATPATHHVGSFIESIDLSSRIATVMPFVEPEMDQALQMAQTSMAASLPTGIDWSSTMSTLDDSMISRPVHTLWWVNGPLKANDTVPVLVFPTNVTGSTSLDLGGTIGTRTAWILAFNEARSLLPPDSSATIASPLPILANFQFALAFNYDQASDLLLNASANIHFGFGEETVIPCDPSASTACPASGWATVMRQFGTDVRASLKLTHTTLDLSQRLTSTESSRTGSNAGSGSGTNSGSGGTTTGAGQPARNPPQQRPQSTSLLPWAFGILGIVPALIVAAGVWTARRRMKKATSGVQTAQTSI